MFNDMKLEILESVNLMTIKAMYADVQPYIKSYSFEDGITLEISHRVYCDKDSNLEVNRYVRINDHIYIILDLKQWSDYVELFLYRCKPDFA